MKHKVAIDDGGRILIPKVIRDTVGIETGTSVYIEQQNGSAIVTPYKNVCIMCGKSKDVLLINNKPLCKKCVKEIKSFADK